MANAGITSNTVTRLLRNLDGELTVNGVAMGAYAKDEIELEVEQEYDAPDLAGTIGTLEGTELIVSSVMRLKVNMKEFGYAQLQVMLGDWGYQTDASSEKIGGSAVSFRKYVHDVVFDGIVRGNQTTKNVKITIPVAVVQTGGLGLGTETSTAEVTFESRVKYDAPRTMQGYIEFEK